MKSWFNDEYSEPSNNWDTNLVRVVRDSASPTLKSYYGTYYTCTFTKEDGTTPLFYIGLTLADEDASSNAAPAEFDLTDASITAAADITNKITSFVTDAIPSRRRL